MKQNIANSILSVTKNFGLLIQAFVDKKKIVGSYFSISMHVLFPHKYQRQTVLTLS
jgi:hypothetical protein